MGGANHFPWGKYLPLPSKQCPGLFFSAPFLDPTHLSSRAAAARPPSPFSAPPTSAPPLLSLGRRHAPSRTSYFPLLAPPRSSTLLSPHGAPACPPLPMMPLKHWSSSPQRDDRAGPWVKVHGDIAASISFVSSPEPPPCFPISRFYQSILVLSFSCPSTNIRWLEFYSDTISGKARIRIRIMFLYSDLKQHSLFQLRIVWNYESHFWVQNKLIRKLFASSLQVNQPH
jgi:hypothetical protein